MVRSLPCLAWALCLLAGTAAAQDPMTPSGEITFPRAETFTRILVGDTEVPVDPPPFIAWLEARAGNLALIGLSQGGNACPATFAWLHTDPGAVRLGPAFGTCSELIEVSHDGETVTVTMPTMSLAEGSVAFVYDGRAITEVALGLPPAEVTPEDGAEALVGRYVFELTGTEDWRGPLVALIGEEGLARAQRLTGQGNPMEPEGDWVAGWGCMPKSCDVGQAAIAVHRGDGRLLVALWDEAEGLSLWGDPAGPLPPTVAAVAAMATR